MRTDRLRREPPRFSLNARSRGKKTRNRRSLFIERLEGRAMLAVDATLALGPPSIEGTVAYFEVSLDYSATANELLAYFSLDVEPSSPELVGDGPDYSAFSFTKTSPLLDQWTQIGFFNDPGFESSVEFDDSLVASLPTGTYVLGILDVDFGAAGISLANPFTVAINGNGTVIGIDDPDQGFSFESVAFNPASRLVTPATLHGDSAIDEGSVYALTIDLSVNVDGNMIITWGDNEQATIPIADLPADGTVTHLFADGDTTPTIQVDVEFTDATRVSIGQLDLAVRNVEPTVPLSGSATVLDGSVYTLTIGTVDDPGQDTVTQYLIDWGDGEQQTIDAAELPANGEVTHTFADGPATPTIAVDLVDEDGTHESAGTLSLTVTNSPPQLELTGPASVDEGAEYTLVIGTVSDPGDDTVSQYVIDWGDGQQQTINAVDLPANGEVKHTYDDAPDVTNIVVDVIDEDGTHEAAGTKSILVVQTAPTVTIDGPRFVEVNTPYELVIGPVTGPGQDDVTDVVIDWGDGEVTSVDVTQLPPDGKFVHTYVDGPAIVDIVIQLVDDEVVLATFTYPIEILGGGDTTIDDFTSSADVPGETKTTEIVDVIAHFTDLGDPGTHTALIDWGDGTDPEPAVVSQVDDAGEVTDTHEYATGGVYTITLELTDDVGDTTTRETTAYVTGFRRVNDLLQIVGSEGNDIITISPLGETSIFVNMTLPGAGNFRQTYALEDVRGVDIFVGAGNDRVMASDRLDLAVYADGGPNNDHVQGSSGPNVLLGGPGDDTILGGTERDILVGGEGRNLMLGYEGDDVLFGGAWDRPEVRRSEVFAIWESDDSPIDRQAAISELIDITADDVADELFGGEGQNVYFASETDLVADTDSHVQYSIGGLIDLGWAQSHEHWADIYTVLFNSESPSAPVEMVSEIAEGTPANTLTAPAEVEITPTDDSLDVNRDGFVTPQDVVVVINALNASSLDPDSLFKLDANQDGFLTPLDALGIVNFLNAHDVAAEGERESEWIVLPRGSESAKLDATSESTDPCELVPQPVEMEEVAWSIGSEGQPIIPFHETRPDWDGELESLLDELAADIPRT